MNKEQTQIQFEAEAFMHDNKCRSCNGTGVAHWIDATTGEEICEPCPNCQYKKIGCEDYMDVYAEPPRN